jgi:gentisate 1,2-dioxygenase
VIPLDASEQLGCPATATSPALSASFVRILEGAELETVVNASSQLFYVIRGKGHSRVGSDTYNWAKGDFITLPAQSDAVHHADQDAAFYWIHDAPLLRYLGVTATERRFEPTLYRHELCEQKLREIIADPVASRANRLSVLLANKAFPQSRTITQSLWAMYGMLPPNTIQFPHRHQSVAVDFVVDSPEGCYTMIGSKLDDTGMIEDGFRADWKPGSVFVTPPGLWHSHHNESDKPGRVLPIQDAGLHTFLRTLDIQFSHVGSPGQGRISPSP